MSSIIKWLGDPKTKQQMAVALPKHIGADRMIRLALTALRTNPALLECEPVSVMGSIIIATQMGLEPNTPLGHSYLVPYNNKKRGTKEAQMILGYKGMIELARRSGQIKSIAARVVRDGDEFEYEYGINDQLVHKATGDEDAPTTHIYAVAHLAGGGYQFEVMTRKMVEKIRQKSPGRDSTFWTGYWEEMAKKTCVRRLFKWLPISIEMQSAVAADERADAGESQMDFVDVDVVDNLNQLAPAADRHEEETPAMKAARELEERERAMA